MKITAIDYYRLHSLGPFENERIGLHAEVDPETENIFDVFKDLKATELSLQKEGLLIEESKKVAEAAEPQKAIATEKPTEEQLSELNWVTKEGNRGNYQQIENDQSEAFKILSAYVKEKGGFCHLYGFKTWLHNNNPNLIDRKR